MGQPASWWFNMQTLGTLAVLCQKMHSWESLTQANHMRSAVSLWLVCEEESLWRRSTKSRVWSKGRDLRAELSGMNKRIEKRRDNPWVSEFHVCLHCSEQLWDEGNDGTGWAGGLAQYVAETGWASTICKLVVINAEMYPSHNETRSYCGTTWLSEYSKNRAVWECETNEITWSWVDKKHIWDVRNRWKKGNMLTKKNGERETVYASK